MALCKPVCFITSFFEHFLCNNSYNKNTWISDLQSEHFFEIRIQAFQKEKNPTLSLRKKVFIFFIKSRNHNFILKRVTSVKKTMFHSKENGFVQHKEPTELTFCVLPSTICHCINSACFGW